MATLTPVAEYLDRGDGTDDLSGQLAAAGDLSNDFKNSGDLIYIVENGGGSPITVTLVAEPDPFGRGGGGDNDVVKTVAAGATALFPFMKPAMFNSGGSTTITLSDNTSVTHGIFRLRRTG